MFFFSAGYPRRFGVTLITYQKLPVLRFKPLPINTNSSEVIDIHYHFFHTWHTIVYLWHPPSSPAAISSRFIPCFYSMFIVFLFPVCCVMLPGATSCFISQILEVSMILVYITSIRRSKAQSNFQSIYKDASGSLGSQDMQVVRNCFQPCFEFFQPCTDEL